MAEIAEIVEMVEQRAVIEQAKGVLMAVYNIDADAAVDLLKWRSQHTNTKLRVLAEQLMTDFRLLQWGQDAARPMLDHLILTAHERVVDGM